MAPTVIFTILAVVLVAEVNGKPPQKILGGNLASKGEFPFDASLRVGGRHHCGGVIISPRHILTAGHCVAQLTDPVQIVTGASSIFDGTIHTPMKIEYPAEYNVDAAASPNDIAVITLKDEIIFNAYQNMIPLASAPPPVGVVATAIGWGFIDDDKSLSPVRLNKIKMRTISGEVCQLSFGSLSLIYTNQICAYKENGAGMCMGDSGSPLVYNGELVGIVSYVVPCGMGSPDVFTSVYHLLPWLSFVINNQV